jgi:chromosome segregation ATPase
MVFMMAVIVEACFMDPRIDDDLDRTAELPVLDLAAINSAAGIEVDHSDLMDELISVRDRIAGLENALADRKIKLSQQQGLYESLQAQHADLLRHGEQVSRDRDHLADEQSAWLAERQDFELQIAQANLENGAALRALQVALSEQQKINAALDSDLQSHRSEAKELDLSRAQAMQELTRAAEEQRQYGETLLADLTETRKQLDEQHAAAATLARGLSQHLLNKDQLESTLSHREQRIGVLEKDLANVSQQLQSSEGAGKQLQEELAEQRREYQKQANQIVETRRKLKLTEESAESLTAKLAAESDQRRATEELNTGLQQKLVGESESLKRTRLELSELQSAKATLQEQFTRANRDVDSLNERLVELQHVVQRRDAVVNAKESAITVLQRESAALSTREAELQSRLATTAAELTEVRKALQEQSEQHAVTAHQLEADRQHNSRLQADLESSRQLVEKHQASLRQRDKSISDQGQKLEDVRESNQLLSEKVAFGEQFQLAQAERIAELTAGLQKLTDENSQNASNANRAQQDLEAKTLEHNATALQMQALQVELRKQADAMSEIRRDIHQVAVQTRTQHSETLVRTLIRSDVNDVVHLLNKPSMTIGRGSDADIIVKSSSISRQHACLRVSRDAVIVEDMGSTNGCYVNGRRIKRQLLKDGDKVELGAVAFQFAARPANNS